MKNTICIFLLTVLLQFLNTSLPAQTGYDIRVKMDGYRGDSLWFGQIVSPVCKRVYGVSIQLSKLKPETPINTLLHFLNRHPFIFKKSFPKLWLH